MPQDTDAPAPPDTGLACPDSSSPAGNGPWPAGSPNCCATASASQASPSGRPGSCAPARDLGPEGPRDRHHRKKARGHPAARHCRLPRWRLRRPSPRSTRTGCCCTTPGDAPPVVLPRDRFLETWNGRLILLTRRAPLAEGEGPFGFRWFLPALLRYRRLFGEVMVASFFVQLLALVTPLFFQVVVDKVAGARAGPDHAGTSSRSGCWWSRCSR